MVLELSITNFRSFKERQVFSMLGSEKERERINEFSTVKEYPGLKFVRTSVVFGPNNSGKSNIIKAFLALRWLVVNSHKLDVNEQLEPNEYFAFSLQTQKQPTVFEIDFIAKDNVRYLLNVKFNSKKVLLEELYALRISPQGKLTKRKCYVRKAGKPIEYGDGFKGARKTVENRLLENMLFISKAVKENNVQLRPVFEFFQQDLNIIDLSDGYIEFQTRYFGKISMEKDGSNKLETLNKAVRDIDSGILFLEVAKGSKLPDNFKIRESENDDLNESEKQARDRLLDTLKHEIKATHRLFDKKKEVGTASLPLGEESEGTRKFIAIYTKLIDLISNGGVFIADELQRSLHPILVQALIQLMENKENNPKNAQIIFTTHDTTLFDILDRDQINILRKNMYGSTELYSISDIKGLRNDVPLQKWYLSGKLSGIPNINIHNLNQSIRTVR